MLLGKCLAPRPRVLVLNNPTRGVDVGARAEIYRALRALAEAGVALVLVSEDLPELLGLSDRLVVMRKGRVAATVPAAALGEEAIVAHMT